MPFIGTQPEVGGYSVLDALTASATASYTLQKDSANFIPNTANQLLVSLNGVIQKPGSSFTVSGSTLTFSSALTSSDSIDFIIAMGEPLLIGTPSDGTVSTSKIADDAVTGAKIENNPTIAGNLTVSGTSTLTGNSTVGGTLGVTGTSTLSGTLAVNGNTTLGNASTDTVTIPGNLTVSGTTTTIDTTVTTSDAMVINNAGSDVGLKVNSTSSGHIMQLQDGGTDVFVVADGGTISTDITMATNKKIKQKGEFLTHSSHRAWVLGS